MPYNYYLSGSPVYFASTEKRWTEGFQTFVDSQFYNSPDAFIIQEETYIGSKVYADVEVRINRGVSAYTGEKLGDDFKLIMFRDLAHATSIGFKYYFDDNFWLVVNSEILKNFAANCLIRRCNNVLRWIDEDGNYYEEPCSIDYKIARPKDEIGSTNPVMPAGYFDIYCQSNVRTRTIKGNQRFIFGPSNNRTAYKIFGEGVRNFLNQKTEDDDSTAVLVFTVGGNFINTETDDLVNGIADAYKIIYDFNMSPTNISGSITNTFQLNPIVTYNGVNVNVPVSFISSASSVAFVSGSGLVTLISNGSAVVTGYMTKNTSASSVCNVIVSASPVSYSEIRIVPETFFILEGNTQNYDFLLYNNGEYVSSSFAFGFSNSLVPSNHYSYTTSASSLSITNISKYINYPLIIDASSGSVVRQIQINLRGAW